jgi:hypothetical protein
MTMTGFSIITLSGIHYLPRPRAERFTNAGEFAINRSHMKGTEWLSFFQLFTAGRPAFHSAPTTSGFLKYANQQETNAF